MFCRGNGDDTWHSEQRTEIFELASSHQAWWGLSPKGKLFTSTFEPQSWHEVLDDSFESIRKLTPDGSSSGELVVVATKNGAEHVARIDAAGRVVESIPMAFAAFAIGAEGGRVAATTGGGVFLLEGNSWRNVMPGCRDAALDAGGAR